MCADVSKCDSRRKDESLFRARSQRGAVFNKCWWFFFFRRSWSDAHPDETSAPHVSPNNGAALRCAACAVLCVRTRAHTTEAAVTGWWRHENTKEAPRGWAPAPGWVGVCAPVKLVLGPRHVNGLCRRIRPRMSALKKVKLCPCLYSYSCLKH